MAIPNYCTQNNGDCTSCSLSNYGRDCENNPLQAGKSRGLDDLWARYMGDVTTPMEYRAQAIAQGKNILQSLEYDLELMYLATGEMSQDEIKRAAFDIWQALEAEKAREGALMRRMEKLNRRGRR
jgi:RNAse (barnase) inhibitor barstar